MNTQKGFLAFGRVVAVVVVAIALVASAVYAVTTIGTNITTEGTLSVTGVATTTGRLVLGSTNPTNNFGQLWIGGNVYGVGVNTTTAALWLGTGGTVNNPNLTGGDLYVQDDAEIDGSLWVDNATTTDSVYFGGYASSTGGLFTAGNGHVGGWFTVGGVATTTGRLVLGSTDPTNDFGQLWIGGNVYGVGVNTTTAALWLGTGGTVNNPNLTGGDLYVQDDAEIDGSLWVDNATTTDSVYFGGYASSTGGLFTAGNGHVGGWFTIGGKATTTGDLIVEGGTIDNNTTTSTSTIGIFSRSHSTATSTVGIGVQENSIGGCLEMVRQSSGTYFKCYVNDAGNFACEAGRCN